MEPREPAGAVLREAAIQGIEAYIEQPLAIEAVFIGERFQRIVACLRFESGLAQRPVQHGLSSSP